MDSNIVEITRSFSYKLNAGNYESRDFFCSYKEQCAKEDAEAVSKAAYEFCKNEVGKSVKEWRAMMEAAKQKTAELKNQ